MAHVSRRRFKTPMEALAHGLKESLEDAIDNPIMPQLVKIQHATQTDRECTRRLAEQLSAGGTDGDFERESIRRRVEAELWWIERAQRDLLCVYGRSVHRKPNEWTDHFGDHFRMTLRDWP